MAPCESDEDKKKGSDGVSRYTIEASTEELLKRFFRPYNKRLFRLLGREIAEWS